jgi:hypothetical protein
MGLLTKLNVLTGQRKTRERTLHATRPLRIGTYPPALWDANGRPVTYSRVSDDALGWAIAYSETANPRTQLVRDERPIETGESSAAITQENTIVAASDGIGVEGVGLDN